MNRRCLWALPLLLSLITVTLHAQAKLAIYGTVGGEKSAVANTPWTLAGTAGFYVGLKKFGPLNLSVDARADLSSNQNSGLIGPRLAVKLPAIPIKPYGEFLIGFSDYSRTSAGLKEANQFAARYVLGADMTILPHIDWRIADFSYDLESLGPDDHAKTLSTGIVIRL
jgi:hypothetical protein